MFNLSNIANAQEVVSTVAKQPSPWTSMIPLLLIMVVFYFLLIRPQQRKMKEHQSMIKAVGKGDEIVTNGGIFGQIVNIEEDKSIVHLLIAEGVKIKIRQDMISEVVKSLKGGVNEVTNSKIVMPKKLKDKKQKI